MKNQISIRESVAVEGRYMFFGGIGKATFHPAEENTGFHFRIGRADVPANLDTAFFYRRGAVRCIGIQKDGERILKVEYVLSALRGLGIDNLVVELERRAIMPAICPRFEYGVTPVVEALAPLRQEGTIPKRYRTVDGEHYETRNGQAMCVEKGEGLTIEYLLDYPYAAIGRQEFEFRFSERGYREQIMGARGMVWLPFGSRAVMQLLAPLHGITDENSLLIGTRRHPTYRNCRAVPRRDEFVRHKMLDFFGELALTGVEFSDVTFRLYRAGHAFKLRALRELFLKGTFRPCEEPSRTGALPAVTMRTSGTANCPTAALQDRLAESLEQKALPASPLP